MVRETMAWYRCDVCGRRGLFYTCRHGARTLHLCPYCLVILHGVLRLRCGQEARELLSALSTSTPVRASGAELAERVRERLSRSSMSRASRR